MGSQFHTLASLPLQQEAPEIRFVRSSVDPVPYLGTVEERASLCR
jgi:hypothetical protein